MLPKKLRRRPRPVRVTRTQIALFALLSTISTALIILTLTIFALPQRVLEEPWVPSPVRETIIASREVASELTIIGNFVNQDDYTLPSPDLSYRTAFEVEVDGFGFRNYGSRYPEGNLSIAQLYPTRA